MLVINHDFAGFLSAIANVPLATSAGFISLTGQKRKAPFCYAAVLITAVSFSRRLSPVFLLRLPMRHCWPSLYI